MKFVYLGTDDGALMHARESYVEQRIPRIPHIREQTTLPLHLIIINLGFN
jgi:hypothetical protein